MQEEIITMSTAGLDVEVPQVRGVVVRSRWMHRLLTFLMVLGPGLIVMVADNDAGAVSTYVQAGAQYGTRLLWTLLLLWPTTYFIQEMVIRLGIATGKGHAAMIYQRFGKWWGVFSLVDLELVNFLTLVTEFAAIALAIEHLGISPYMGVPVATGAAMFVMLAMPNPDMTMRVAARVVSGIGFLGAGVIMREGLTVRGLNTAATLWCSAAVGTLSGSGQSRLAVIGAAGVLLANFGLRPLARLIDRQPSEPDCSTEICYSLRLLCRSEAENRVRTLLLHMTQALPLALQSLHSEDLDLTGRVEGRAEFHSLPRQDAALENVV